VKKGGGLGVVLSDTNAPRNNKPSDKLRWAKRFLERGFAIFPIDAETKKPVIKEWQKYSTTPLSEEEKNRFLDLIQKGYNYAVPGGQNGLVILDFEDKEALKAWLGEDELGKLCDSTLCVDTPHGGLHVYLIADNAPPQKFNPLFVKDGKGIADLQSFNSYVVGPGSCINHKHCESTKCPWKGQDYSTCYIPYNNNVEISKTNLKALLKFLEEKGKRLGIELSPSARGWLEGKEKKEETEEDFDELKKELLRHDNGKSPEKIKAEICDKEEKNKLIKEVICQGKTYAEIGIDRSRGDWRVILYLMKHGVTDPDKILQLLPPDSKAKVNEKWDTEKYFLETLKNAWAIAKKFIEAKRAVREDKAKARELLIEVIAEEILKEHRIVTFIGRDQLKEWIIGLFMFSKKKGIYLPVDAFIEKIINKKLEEYAEFKLGVDKSRVVKNVKDEIVRRTMKLMPNEPMRIAFKNGTLEWTEKGITWYDLKERSPNVYAFHYIDWNLKIQEIERFVGKEITVEDIEQLARRICPKSLEAFKAWVDDKWVLLFEIIGYTLYPRYVFNKAVLLTGAGSNGKTTFLNLLLKILGKNNVSAVSLKRIVEVDKFASIELYHRLANISSELFQFRVTNTDLFKKLTGEDYVEGQKKFKDPIYFVNYAKLINATNELPIVKDQTYGFWRRWIVIEFPHQFEHDPTFFDRTFTNEEIVGVITVSLLAFARVMQQRKFDFEDTSADIKEKWERASDSVYAFVKDLIESGRAEYDPKNGDLFTPVKEFYQAYVEWCEENDRKPEAQQTVTRRLESRFRITKSQKRIKGERVWCYVGIRLKGENENSNENSTGGDGSDKLMELYKQYSGQVRSRKELQDELGLRAYELLDFCEKRNLCHWIDEEHVEFH
jgi:putative DNA primase/helicase